VNEAGKMLVVERKATSEPVDRQKKIGEEMSGTSIKVASTKKKKVVLACIRMRKKKRGKKVNNRKGKKRSTRLGSN